MYKSIEFSQIFIASSKSLWMTVKTASRVAINNAVLLLKRRYELTRQRHHLANLMDAQLLDIGISRQAAVVEAQRPASDDPLFPAKHNKFWI